MEVKRTTTSVTAHRVAPPPAGITIAPAAHGTSSNGYRNELSTSTGQTMNQQAAIVLSMSLIIGATVGTMTTSPVGAQPGPPCTGTNHCVDITIASGAIRPVPAVVVTGRNHQIYWRITTAGYSFDSPPQPAGIAFKQPSSINDNGRMPANEFPCNRLSPTLFHCADANSTLGSVRSYQYSITVIDAAAHRIVSDPWVVNK